MLSLRDLKQSESDVVKAVKTAIDACDAEDLKSKKFVGLLNDYIKDQYGLKNRLEIMGKIGMISMIGKTLKESNPTPKLEKMALQFSKTYGFTQEVTSNTFDILTMAISDKKSVSPVTLKIVEPVHVVQGGFSKKHFTQSSPPPSTAKIQTNGLATPKKRKWVRNTFNLWAYVLLILVIPLSYIGLNVYFDKLPILKDVFFTRFHPHFYVETPFVIAAVITLTTIVTPYAINRFGKKNSLSYYPLLSLLFQVITFQLASTHLSFYMDLQMLFGLGTLVSFGILGFYAMRLPKGAFDYTAYRSIGPYYWVTSIWLLGQYIVYSRALGI